MDADANRLIDYLSAILYPLVGYTEDNSQTTRNLCIQFLRGSGGMLDFNMFHPRRKEGVVLRTLGDEAILYDPETKKVHVLNVTSMFIWNLCTGNQNLEGIEKEVKSRFKVDEDSNVITDIKETITRFSVEGLLMREE